MQLPTAAESVSDAAASSPMHSWAAPLAESSSESRSACSCGTAAATGPDPAASAASAVRASSARVAQASVSSGSARVLADASLVAATATSSRGDRTPVGGCSTPCRASSDAGRSAPRPRATAARTTLAGIPGVPSGMSASRWTRAGVEGRSASTMSTPSTTISAASSQLPAAP